MTWRAATTACSPSRTIATSGPPVMNSTSSPKNGLPSCSAGWRLARSSSTVMCLSATMRRPLRSKRAMISPVRPRANASGLTRIRVRSIGGQSFRSERSGRRRRLVRRRGALLDLAGRLAAAPAPRHGRVPGHLGLAVRADRPLRVERLAAVRARVLELAHAVGAAQEVLLDVRLAVRAHEVAALLQARLGRLHLELALAHVVEVLGRAHDHVHNRPDE